MGVLFWSFWPNIMMGPLAKGGKTACDHGASRKGWLQAIRDVAGPVGILMQKRQKGVFWFRWLNLISQCFAHGIFWGQQSTKKS